jgi:methylglyoxal synthase
MKRKNIALVAHDARKNELIEWVTYNIDTLSKHNIFATGTTGKLIEEVVETLDEELLDDCIYQFITPLKGKVTKLLSGPLGGDQQIGAMIAEGKIDCLIFFCDNLITQGHAQDIQALSRLASLYNVAYANNRTTADMIITSPLFSDETYKRNIPSCIETYASRFNQ